MMRIIKIMMRMRTMRIIKMTIIKIMTMMMITPTITKPKTVTATINLNPTPIPQGRRDRHPAEVGPAPQLRPGGELLEPVHRSPGENQRGNDPFSVRFPLEGDSASEEGGGCLGGSGLGLRVEEEGRDKVKGYNLYRKIDENEK